MYQCSQWYSLIFPKNDYKNTKNATPNIYLKEFWMDTRLGFVYRGGSEKWSRESDVATCRVVGYEKIGMHV